MADYLEDGMASEAENDIPSADYDGSDALCYPCEDCIGMAEHGCYCKAMGAKEPGGPLPDYGNP